MKKLYFLMFGLALVVLGVVSLGSSANATHAWGNYHWARTANPFTLKTVDSVTSAWDGYLDTSISDWSLSSVLDLTKESGSTTNFDRRRCWGIAGKIHACNYTYGNNGWLGLASIWASGDHITQGTTKVNDTYFNTATYNTPAWRNLVMCQEIAHDFGLDHQDVIFDNPNLGTCMDYTNNPGTNQHPNQHDYDVLETIYAHLDTTTSVAQSAASSAPQDIELNDRSTWGREIRRSEDGRASLFMRDLGNGQKVFTHVFWAEPQTDRFVRAR